MKWYVIGKNWLWDPKMIHFTFFVGIILKNIRNLDKIEVH